MILDVVFNHTAGGNHDGPTLSFRSLENGAYYNLEKDRSRYANYSGTGNTLNGNHPIVRRLILDSLRYWVQEMHVDGFRFDLASILDRDESGNLLPNPPVLWISTRSRPWRRQNWSQRPGTRLAYTRSAVSSGIAGESGMGGFETICAASSGATTASSRPSPTGARQPSDLWSQGTRG